MKKKSVELVQFGKENIGCQLHTRTARWATQNLGWENPSNPGPMEGIWTFSYQVTLNHLLIVVFILFGAEMVQFFP